MKYNQVAIFTFKLIKNYYFTFAFISINIVWDDHNYTICLTYLLSISRFSSSILSILHVVISTETPSTIISFVIISASFTIYSSALCNISFFMFFLYLLSYRRIFLLADITLFFFWYNPAASRIIPK